MPHLNLNFATDKFSPDSLSKSNLIVCLKKILTKIKKEVKSPDVSEETEAIVYAIVFSPELSRRHNVRKKRESIKILFF